MNPTVFERLESLLTDRGAAFDVLHHAPVFTSAEAAAVRGTSLASGAKALVCLGDGHPLMIVLPADLKLDSAATRKTRGWKSLRFADKDEVARLTGLAPGSIPPFGALFSLPTFCDDQLAENERINFNAGGHEVSLSMTYADYVAVERPTMGAFAVRRGVDA